MTYRPPVRDMAFTLNEVAGLSDLLGKGAYEDVSADLVEAVMEEGAKLAADVLAPLNRSGDAEGAKLKSGAVSVPSGFAEAYRRWVEGGWGSLAATTEYGGQGLPVALSVAMQEMWNAACLSFGLCPILSQGAIEALTAHGTEEQKNIYLARLISGEWTGTMNLTEPQAGSDLNALKTKAVPQGDGTYRISGTKIYITYGDHDMAENIVHLVLARLPDAPPGTKGISLFLVPKFLVNEDGSLGARNDAWCIGLEEKLGIHGSPTCVMSYGENGGAIGTLIGQENRGLACMFTMMNNARLLVGTQGVAIAEAAYQHALAYAKDRKQGRPLGSTLAPGEMAPIIEHPDIRRMLLTMKSLTDASRAICYATAVAIDGAHAGDKREEAQARADLLTPIAKSFSTDIGVEVASIGVQIHGGMGFIEETGAAQFLRDARILPIYEGTNGIQAIDLVSRKLPLGNGSVVKNFIAEMRETAQQARSSNNKLLGEIGGALDGALDALDKATDYMLANLKSAPNDCLAGASPYLRLFGTAAGGHYLAQSALRDPAAKARLALAQFYAANVLPAVHGLLAPATAGADSLFALTADDLA
ncbi:acyl-CoA dehydrogenase domain protein [Parvibaculum lavamentivorans DS-1]|uniref:3-methylmercaptopropionyl-CoA dehydrogenase n=1 Tax=Parvibaculum lavamentivorans (strain DS-1 / DSM 13023 / NCIMB 13966) TaxID=402881 RepID=A7HR65_PARL1|nr:acyl-CoA dehydrogenase [Parvibaculum lavamentivorans]ABS62398.1 acyl-CoA dehydrogenase domain protein [Parvibaculum lavamentivorans DS-1]